MEPYKTIAALAITFGLLGGFLWLLRVLPAVKGGRTALWNRPLREKQLQSIEKLVLGPDCTLHLVAVEGETILLAISNRSVVPIQPRAIQAKAFQTSGGAA